MARGAALSLVVLALVLACAEEAGARHMFFRTIRHMSGTRRVFGGGEARVGAYPSACALLDPDKETTCSCSVLAARWALTAAHCAQPSIEFVHYNGPGHDAFNLAHVRAIYRHPAFKSESKDMGSGPDVVRLQHDVGLVRTRGDMTLAAYSFFPLPYTPRARGDDIVSGMMIFDTNKLYNKEVDVLGFGMTEAEPAGERLRMVKLRMADCMREGWVHCVCAVGSASGVCSGDSGGPVLYNNTQIGVMSMGPVECGTPLPLGAGSGSAPAQSQAVSVFTALRPYAELINATVHDVDDALRMREVKRLADAAAARPRGRMRAVVCAASLLLCRSF